MSLLATGVAFFTSIITVRLKDLQHIAEVGIQMLFYATPIIYHIDSVPEPYKSILVYNPLFIFIQSIRNAMISGQISFLAENIILAIISLIIFVSGWIFFNKSVRKIAQYF
jgi:ABC-type polysaccharide/polyol phosphate export permease